MKEKIIEEVYNKLCKGFNVQFLRRKDFEIEFPIFSIELTSKISNILELYNTLKISKKKEDYLQVFGITSKEDYAIEKAKYHAGSSINPNRQ